MACNIGFYSVDRPRTVANATLGDARIESGFCRWVPGLGVPGIGPKIARTLLAELAELVNESASPYRRSIVVRNGPQTESLQSDVMRLPSAEIVPMQLPTE